MQVLYASKLKAYIITSSLFRSESKCALFSFIRLHELPHTRACPADERHEIKKFGTERILRKTESREWDTPAAKRQS